VIAVAAILGKQRETGKVRSTPPGVHSLPLVARHMTSARALGLVMQAG